MTALYQAVVEHVRQVPPKRAFQHKIYLWLVDLDRLPKVVWWLRPFARFEARDHLGSPHRTIRQNLDAWLGRYGIDLRGGQVLMLANARVLGHVFNPVSVFWCHRPDGTLACVVAEVHNTYGERHCYLLDTDENGNAITAKEFYVSPFQQMGGDYVMRLPKPDEKLALAIRLIHHGQTPLVATLRGVRTPASTRDIVRAVLNRPLITRLVSALIRRHGIALWLRRVPIVRRTPHAPQEGVQ
ncbi:DUF1365 domain-containing protein [Kibdelosporangium philippinense]|uniref:DUF1365 domain-containing protein n=1 Tax=Kibdelosporangium philippinense TaxID=211113 RepID=A0ABS8Z9D6_9PSEU|nr:DUF1365 domain-containing protein [Kibdelosporangium philippinense]MCE7004491.1 DUF1365 domain-containing protein [Kibdelosporangium philippinense]